MPQVFRILPQEGCLHVLTRGNNKQQVFHDDRDYKSYLNFIKLYKQDNKISIYHYCLMPNHVHLIVEITPKSNLAKFMKQVNLAYQYHYKKKYKYCGHFWQGRYKSLIISRDEYLVICARYIEINPVRAKIVKKAEDYNYSSYRTYAYGSKDDIVSYNPIYLEWGRTEKERRLNYIKDIKGELERIAINLNARFIGTDEFITKMEEKFKVSNIKGEKGRPKKTGK